MNQEVIIRHGSGSFPREVRTTHCGAEKSDCMPCRGKERCVETPISANSMAMVFSPHQHFRDLYEPEEALFRRGTLFRELYKPFQPGGRIL